MKASPLVHAHQGEQGSESLKTVSVPTLEDLGDVSGKRVLVRADFNVPLVNGEITDDLRIRAALPTLQWLLDNGADVTAMSHLGRPKGEPNPKYSIEPVREHLKTSAPGVTLLENLRFDPGETSNDPAFVEKLIEGQDLYVNDAFGASHRAHASIVGPPAHLPCAAGRLLSNEVEILGGVRDNARKPFVAIMGGSKVSDKVAVIESLLPRVDRLLIGGGMSYTFFAAMGHSVGESLLQEEMIEYCKGVLENTDKIVLPSDISALGPGGELFNPDAGGEVRQVGREIPDGWNGVDIGPGTAAEFSDIISDAQTVLWNGPVGVFEDPRFEAGTKHIAQALADSSAFTVIGGGDSAAAAKQFGLDDDMDHVSTGGGASLELLEKGDLPGLAALRGEFSEGEEA